MFRDESRFYLQNYVEYLLSHVDELELKLEPGFKAAIHSEMIETLKPDLPNIKCFNVESTASYIATLQNAAKQIAASIVSALYQNYLETGSIIKG